MQDNLSDIQCYTLSYDQERAYAYFVVLIASIDKNCIKHESEWLNIFAIYMHVL